jgi:MarR family transcriptional regulator, organic hydroperoxide resistance regulator
MSTILLQEMIERITRLLQSDARSLGAYLDIQPIQLEALHYLTSCNRYSNTLQGVTEYFGLTKGTVSQTIKTLEKKGLLQKKTDKQDKRVIHLTVSSSGKKLLQKTLPSPIIDESFAALSIQKREQLMGNLQILLREIQKANSMKTFGVCHTCKFNKKLDGGSFLCELTKEKLTKEETTLICREHMSLV